MTKKTRLNYPEKLILVEYIDNIIKRMGDAFYTRNPQVGNDSDKLEAAKVRWYRWSAHSMYGYPACSSELLSFAKDFLTEKEFNNLIGYLQTWRHKDSHQIVSVCISEHAHNALRNWQEENGDASQSECIETMIWNARLLKGSADEDILDARVPYEKNGKKPPSISIKRQVREALNEWKQRRKYHNISQSIIDLVDIARATRQRKK